MQGASTSYVCVISTNRAASSLAEYDVGLHDQGWEEGFSRYPHPTPTPWLRRRQASVAGDEGEGAGGLRHGALF